VAAWTLLTATAEVRVERGGALFTARNDEGTLVEFQRSLALSGGVG
jgi:hypothetical protein